MKIALVSSIVPFVDDGDRSVVREVAVQLEAVGHHVHVLWLPRSTTTRTLIRELTAYRTLDITDFADAMVCFDSPAHLVRHPRKIVWYLSRSSSVDVASNVSLHDSVRRADAAAMGEASRIFASSETMRYRLREEDQADSEVLLPAASSDLTWSMVADRLLS